MTSSSLCSFFTILLCFRWQRSRTGVLPAPTAQPTSSGTTGPRTSTEWDSRAWWATPIAIHIHKRLQLTGLCVATHPPPPRAQCTTHRPASHKLGFFIRAMCGAGIVRGSWVSYLHDKRNLSPFCLFTRERESTWTPKAKRAMGVACVKRASVIEVRGYPFIGCSTFCDVWISANLFAVGLRLLSVIAIYPYGVRSHLPLELLIRFG